MEQGLTVAQLKIIRKHYLEQALADREVVKKNRRNGTSFTTMNALKKENLNFAHDLKSFWPVILGAK